MKTENEVITKKESQSDIFSDMIDFDEGKKGIQKILKTHFNTLNGYSNMYLLWSAAENQISMFLNDNGIDSEEKCCNMKVTLIGL